MALIDLSHVVRDGLTTYPGLPDEGARFHAVPLKVAGMGTFPVRAYALTGEG